MLDPAPSADKAHNKYNLCFFVFPDDSDAKTVSLSPEPNQTRWTEELQDTPTAQGNQVKLF